MGQHRPAAEPPAIPERAAKWGAGTLQPSANAPMVFAGVTRAPNMAPPICLIRRAAEPDLPAIAAIHLASWQDAYQGVVPEAVLRGRSIADCLAGWRATFAAHAANITIAASSDGRIHGFCCAGPVVDTDRNAPFEFEVY